MKKILLGVILLLFSGCTPAQLAPVEHVIRDQQFEQYKVQLDQLEKEYLQKTITYAEYLEKKELVEQEYQSKIDNRRHIIQNNNEPKLAIEMLP